MGQKSESRAATVGGLDRRSLLSATVALPGLLGVGSSRPGQAAEDAGGMTVKRLAWAGVLVEVGDVALFVDATSPEAGQAEAASLFSTQRTQKFAMVTHHHSDHFDNAAVRGILGDTGTLIVPRDVAPFLDDRGLRMQPTETWQPIFIPRAGSDIVAWPVPAVDGFGAPQCSWIIDGGGRRIFHGGDTQWHGLWTSLGRAYGPFDAAFLPINGARQNYGRFVDAGIPAVLTPEQAVIAATQLGAGRLVPIHYGEPDPPIYFEIDRPLERLQQAAAAAHLLTTVLGPGERRSL